MKNLAFFILLFFLPCGPALAEPVLSGDYVAVEAPTGGRWHLAPLSENNGKTLNVRLIPSSSTNAQVFVIEKVDLSDGSQVHDGNYVRLRGINSNYFNGRDPWIMVEGGDVDRVNISDKHPDLGMDDPTILFIRSPDHDVSYGSSFKIRGTSHGDNWFARRSYNSLVGFTQDEGSAESFVFERPDDQMMLDDHTISDHHHPAGLFSQILGGFFNLFSQDHDRPACPYFTSCPDSRPPPSSAGNPTPAGGPTVRVEQPGSSLYFYIANPSDRSYTCTLAFSYQWESFGDIQHGSDEVTRTVAAHTPDTWMWKLTGSYVHLRLSGPYQLGCQ